MVKNILVLDDGTEIAAGTVGQNAILSLTCTETVSKTTDLCPGSACSNKLEITIWVEPGTDLPITSGTRLTHYREDESETRTLCGTYWAVKPTRQTRNTYKIYAYDAVSRLDGIQSTWLRSIQGQFPMTLWTFAQLVAQRCGVTITNAALPRNGGYQVQAFYADDLTGRQLLAWVAEASCTFLRATPAGQLEFAWYTDHARSGIGPGSGSAWTALGLSGQLLATADGEVWTFAQPQAGYFSGGLSYEDYTTAPIDKVQIRQSDDDVGVLYPAEETGTHALVIQGNLLLTTQTADALRPVAQAIYETMQGVTYTPMRVEIPYTSDAPSPGEIITVTDAYGRQMQTYIMSSTISGKRVTLESTGNARRDSTAAVNEQKYANLQGKVLEISANVEGLKVTASDLAGGLTRLEQTVDSITLSAESEGSTSKLVLSANGVELTSANITFTGMVTFADLSTAGKTTVNGSNINTGCLANHDRSALFDLDGKRFRMGTSSGERVFIDKSGIQWYGGTGTTGATAQGVIKNGLTTTSSGDTTVYGADTRYQKYGWYHGGNFQGITVEQVDNEVMVSGNLSVNQAVSCRTLKAWDAKERVVRTPLGNLQMNAMESPEPLFWDVGSGVCDSTGVCWIALRPEYAETISRRTALRWVVTPTGGPGSLWVEKLDTGAMVHGGAGQRFDWACAGVQRGFEGCYAEGDPGRYPVPENPGDWLLTAAIDEAAVDLPLTI